MCITIILEAYAVGQIWRSFWVRRMALNENNPYRLNNYPGQSPISSIKVPMLYSVGKVNSIYIKKNLYELFVWKNENPKTPFWKYFKITLNNELFTLLVDIVFMKGCN